MQIFKQALQTLVGDKPAWVLIVAAALAGLGGTLASVLIAGGNIGLASLKRWYDGGDNFRIVVQDSRTKLLDGARIRLMKPPSVPLDDKGSMELVTENGVAESLINIKPGSYILITTYEMNGSVYERSDPIKIEGPFERNIKFEPSIWAELNTDSKKRETVLESYALSKPTNTEPLWMQVARREIGQREIPGDVTSNPRIIEYMKSSGKNDFDNEIVAWQGAFVNWVLSRVNIKGVDNPLGVRGWLKWGNQVELTPGCIAIFWRESPESWMGHMGFLVRDNGDTLEILGGNQQDSVNLSAIPRSRLLSCRMPA